MRVSKVPGTRKKKKEEKNFHSFVPTVQVVHHLVHIYGKFIIKANINIYPYILSVAESTSV